MATMDTPQPPNLNGDAKYIWQFLEYLKDELTDFRGEVRDDIKETRNFTLKLFLALLTLITTVGVSILGILLTKIL